MGKCCCSPYRRKAEVYREHFVCFPCRKQFKKPAGTREALCPDCGQPMTPVNKDFRPPRRANENAWKRIKAFEDKGFFPDGSPKS